MTRPDGLRALALGAATLLCALLGTCGGSDGCVQTTCSSGAAMQIPIASSAASLHGATVTVCRNAECHTAALPDAGGANSSAALVFADATFVLGTLWQDAQNAIELDVEWHVGSPDLAVDGDHYVVTLTAAAGTVTTLLDQTATYGVTASDPRACTPTTCRFADLAP